MAAPTAGLTTQDEWDVVSEGTRIKIQFDTIGDVFIGVKEGTETIVNPNENKDGKHDEWEQYNFRGIYPPEIMNEPCGIAAGYELARTLDKISTGTTCRLTYVRDTDTGQVSPMKSFKVETKR